MQKFLSKFSALLIKDILKKADSSIFYDPPMWSTLSTTGDLLNWIKTSCPSAVYKAVMAEPQYGFICSESLRSVASPTDKHEQNFLIHLSRIILNSDADCKIDGDVVSVIFPPNTTKQILCDLLADITGLLYEWDYCKPRKSNQVIGFYLDTGEKRLPVSREKLNELCEQLNEQVISISFVPLLLFVDPSYVRKFSDSAMHCRLAVSCADIKEVKWQDSALSMDEFLGLNTPSESEDANGNIVTLFSNGEVDGSNGIINTDLDTSEWDTKDTITLVAIISAIAALVFLASMGYLQEAAAAAINRFSWLSPILGWLANAPSLKKRKGKNIYLGNFSSDDFYTLCRMTKTDPHGHCTLGSLEAKIIDYDSTMPFHLVLRCGGTDTDLYIYKVEELTLKDEWNTPVTLLDAYSGVNRYTVRMWTDSYRETK